MILQRIEKTADSRPWMADLGFLFYFGDFSGGIDFIA